MTALVEFTAPATEPLTISEVMNYCHVDQTDDLLFEMFIKSARVAAEGRTRRALITQTLDLYLDEFPLWDMTIPKPKLQSVTSVTYTDTDGVEQTLSASNYQVDTASAPARIAPSYGNVWPTARFQMNAVKIRYIAGYGAAADVPSGIKNWMLLRIGTLWENRASLLVDSNAKIIELPWLYVDAMLDEYSVKDYGWAG